MSDERRVVVTGMGALSPVGIGCRQTFDNLIAGVSGVDHITHFDPSGQETRIAGEVKGFDALASMDRKAARRLGRYAQFAIAATREAMDQARLDLSAEDPDRVASLVASAIGDFPLLEEQIGLFTVNGPGRVNPFTVPRVSTSMAAGNISLLHGLTGPSFGTASACATGSHSIACAWMMLKAGLADVAFAGGTEAAISPAFIESYIAMRALSRRNDDPAGASRPFDRARDGFVIGEGCGVLLLETLEHARARGAPVLAELAGVGMTCDAYHITSAHPQGQGAASAMRLAIQSAGAKPADVDWINAHGTATPVNDPIETMAIKRVLCETAYDTPVSSIKSMIGHCIGAAGALAAITSVMALLDGVVPPTINLDHPDPACDLDYVPNTARRRTLRLVLANSFAFGGQNCVLAFRRNRAAM